MKDWLARFITLVTKDIWLKDYSHSGPQRHLIGILQWLYLAGYGFLRDNCLLRAAALSYTTVLSIAPFLAVAFSISKGLGLHNTSLIRELLLRFTAGRTEMVDSMLSYVNDTSVRTLGAVGMMVLLGTALSLAATIEKAFNDVWGVPHGRTPWRKFTDFFSVMLICPLFLLLAVSFTYSINNQNLMHKVLSAVSLDSLIIVIFKLIPYVSIWMALTFLYMFIPNTRVHLKSGIIGAVIAGTAWQAAQWAYVTYQFGAAKYNAIYGSFAQFPLFLVWLYISWVIVLLGAEISFAVQNMASFQSEVRSDHLSHGDRGFIAVLAMLVITRAFEEGQRPMFAENIARHLGAPRKVVSDTLLTLNQAGFVIRAEAEEGQAYALGMDPDKVHIFDILLALYGANTIGQMEKENDHMAAVDPRFTHVSEIFKEMETSVRDHPRNATLKELYQQLCELDEQSRTVRQCP